MDQLGLVMQAFSWRNRCALGRLFSAQTVSLVLHWLETADFGDDETREEEMLTTMLENAPDCAVWCRSVAAMVRVYVRRTRLDVNTFTLDFPHMPESRLSMYRRHRDEHVAENAADGDWLSQCMVAETREEAFAAAGVETEGQVYAVVHRRIRDAVSEVPLSPSISPEQIVATVAYGMQCLLYLDMDIGPLRCYLMVGWLVGCVLRERERGAMTDCLIWVCV
jgi:hypothetical protein